MRKLLESVGLFLGRIFPIVLVTVSVYLYYKLIEDNRKLKERVDSLSSLISYKSAEMMEIIKNNSDSTKRK